MGESRDTYRLMVGKHEENKHLKDLGVDGRIILKLAFMNWIDLLQDRDMCQAIVNAVMNLRIL
jgi:hypothetical protein